MGNKPDMFPQYKSQKAYSTDITVDVVVRSSFTWSRNASVFITARKRSLGQGFFLHLSVTLFTGGEGGGVSAPLHAGIHTHPGHTHAPGHIPPPTHTPWTHAHAPLDTHTHPPTHTHTHTPHTHTPGDLLDPPQDTMGQQIRGTHPTGMHTCICSRIG